MIENIISSAFGINCKIEKTKVKGMALYMTAGREFFMADVEGLSFLLVKISSDDRFGAIALEKQLAALKIAMECEVAIWFESLTKLQREALLKRHIPFIAGSDQIYLPFLGIMLRNNLKTMNNVVADKMMPATQCLFLYLLYSHQHEYVLKKQAAEELGLTRTSITRASEQLKAMELITEEHCGKEVRMKTVATGYKLYSLARDYLITPIQRRMYVEKTDETEMLAVAGESALSEVSMLGEPKIAIRATFKSDEIVKGLKEVDIKWQESIDTVMVEVWKYNPMLFAKDGLVDLVSMAMSLSDTDDERVQGELERYMEEYEW